MSMSRWRSRQIASELESEPKKSTKIIWLFRIAKCLNDRLEKVSTKYNRPCPMTYLVGNKTDNLPEDHINRAVEQECMDLRMACDCWTSFRFGWNCIFKIRSRSPYTYSIRIQNRRGDSRIRLFDGICRSLPLWIIKTVPDDH